MTGLSGSTTSSRASPRLTLMCPTSTVRYLKRLALICKMGTDHPSCTQPELGGKVPYGGRLDSQSRRAAERHGAQLVIRWRETQKLDYTDF